jgi:hypothetical protein
MVAIKSALARRWAAAYGRSIPVGKHTFVGWSKSLDVIPEPSSILLDHNLSRDVSLNARRRRRRRQWGDQALIDELRGSEVVDPPEPGLKKD